MDPRGFPGQVSVAVSGRFCGKQKKPRTIKKKSNETKQNKTKIRNDRNKLQALTLKKIVDQCLISVDFFVPGPSKPVSSQLEPQPDSTIKATYFPSERGPHTVHVKLDGKNIDGENLRIIVEWFIIFFLRSIAIFLE